MGPRPPAAPDAGVHQQRRGGGARGGGGPRRRGGAGGSGGAAAQDADHLRVARQVRPDVPRLAAAHAPAVRRRAAPRRQHASVRRPHSPPPRAGSSSGGSSAPLTPRRPRPRPRRTPPSYHSHRTNLEKTFDLEEVYDADYSSVQIATPKAPASGGEGGGPHKVVIKTFKKDKLLTRPDLQQKVGGESAGRRRSGRRLRPRRRQQGRQQGMRSCQLPRPKTPSPRRLPSLPFPPLLFFKNPQLKLEWDIHASLVDHPNIIKAYLATEDDRSVGLFMEYAGESDAYSYLSAKQRLSLREDDARQLMHDVLSALQFMHEQARRCGGGGGGGRALGARRR
jgi:serine/threonine protein kinase